MASSTAEREVVRLPLASSQDVNRAEGRRDAIDVFRADTPSTSDEEPSDVQVLPEKQLPQQIQEILNVVLKHVSKKFEEVSKKFEEVKTSVDNLQKQLQPVLPGPSQRVTDGETPLPTGFVPVLPKDPYEVLTYFGFPASTPDSLVSKHRHYFLGNASTEPMRTHRLALRKALVQLCLLHKPQSGKGCDPSWRTPCHGCTCRVPVCLVDPDPTLEGPDHRELQRGFGQIRPGRLRIPVFEWLLAAPDRQQNHKGSRTSDSSLFSSSLMEWRRRRADLHLLLQPSPQDHGTA
ncbi:uncharacterized protein LOC126990395 [Eriocheir sinensis]|uniref:uncharacterized protein LOC126990395 n=1 Tax=Eriocheir sinensis TaxID=95602 RepID=UPI0021C66DEE|nr:uncharacterized protein LOC126990395 [Eriocheir sinensis]